MNGVGKTNLLDAVHYLSLTKSYFNSTDSQNITFDKDFFVIQGSFITDNEINNVYCGLIKNKRKQFKLNDIEYEKLSDHIGLFPVVMVSPNDNSLITGTSEERRKFMDSVISIYNRDYLDSLIRYNKVITQRNRLLKDIAGDPSPDLSLLDILDEQLNTYGIKIFTIREAFIKDFIPVFQKYYDFICQGNEVVNIHYESDFQKGDFFKLLKKNFQKDRVLQHTSVGIHRDDLHLEISGYPLKKTGSQGQQKTYLVALKMAQFDFIAKTKGFKPILLLDDIFDKFDIERVKQIIKLVEQNQFGQIFITDTHQDRIKEILNETKKHYQQMKLKHLL